MIDTIQKKVIYFDDKFTTISNHLENNQTELFETIGKELEFIQNQDIKNVWTVVEGDEEDKLYVIPGFQVVNIVGYLFTEEQWTEEDKDIDYLY